MKHKSLLNTIGDLATHSSESALNSLKARYPAEGVEATNAQLKSLSRRFTERIQHYSDKYMESELGMLETGESKVDGEKSSEGFEQDLTEMKSLVVASKELTEVIRDAQGRVKESRAKDYCQMLMTVCGTIEAIIENSQ